MSQAGPAAAALGLAALIAGATVLETAVRPTATVLGLAVPARSAFLAALAAAAGLALAAAARASRRPARPVLVVAGAPLLAAVASTAAARAPLLAVAPILLLAVGGLWAAAVSTLDERGRNRLDAGLAALPALLSLPALWEFGRNVAALGPAGQGLQVEGAVGNANVLAAASAATVPFAAALDRRLRDRPPWRAAAAASAVLGVATVIVAGSRTGYLALLAAGAVGLLGVSTAARRLVGAALAVAAALVVGWSGPRLLLAADPGYVTNVQRLRIARNALDALAAGPREALLGWGPGAAPFVYPRFQTAEKWELHYHALPLQAAVETGLVGVAAWGLAAAALASLLARAVRAGRGPEAAPAAACAGALLVGSIGDHLLWIPLLAGLYWTAVGRLGAVASPHPVPPARRAAALGPTAAWVVSVALAGASFAPVPTAADAVAEAIARRDAAAAERAIRLNPLDAGARNAAAGLALLAGETAAAEAAYRAALAADPWADFAPHHLDLALLLLRTGRGAEARPLVEAARRRHPNLARWFVEGVLSDAEREALGLEPPPTEIDPRWTQDLLYATVDLYPSPHSPETWTFERIEEAVGRGDPYDWRLRRALGGRLLETGHVREALRQLRRGEYLRHRQDRPDPLLLDRLALAAAASGEGALAEKARAAADRADRPVWPYAGIAALAYGRPDLAGRDLRVSLWPHPGVRPRRDEGVGR